MRKNTTRYSLFISDFDLDKQNPTTHPILCKLFSKIENVSAELLMFTAHFKI